jgi:hypothetical protein
MPPDAKYGMEDLDTARKLIVKLIQKFSVTENSTELQKENYRYLKTLESRVMSREGELGIINKLDAIRHICTIYHYHGFLRVDITSPKL